MGLTGILGGRKGQLLAAGVAALLITAGGFTGYLIGGGGGDAGDGDELRRSLSVGDARGDRSPAAWIDRPTHGEVRPVGVFVVNSHATAVDGIASMTMEVNGDRQVESRSGASLEHVDWSYDATTPGTYTIEVWGTTTGGMDTPPSIATVIVVAPVDPVPAETEVPVATPAPTATAAANPSTTATPTGSPSPTSTAVPEPTTTVTPIPSPTPIPTPTATATPVPTSTATPGPTPSPEPTVCALTPPWLTSPGEGAMVISTAVTLVWTPNDDCNTNAWQVQLAEDPGFVDVDYDVTVPAVQTSWSAPPLSTCSTWYWRVQPAARLDTWSVTWSFQTDCG